jgi:hypothetical protein
MIGPAGSTLSSRWGWILPALMIVAVAAAALQPVRSYDLGWHLAAGRLILEQGKIPTEDPFSFTRAGTPWLDHEWLFQVAACGLFLAGGPGALLALVLLLALGSCVLMTAWLKGEGMGWPLVSILLVLSLSGARFRFDTRPEMASLFFMVLLLSILHWSRSPERIRAAFLLPPLFALWANTHPGAVLGAALMALWVLGEWAQGTLTGGGFPGGLRRGLLCLLSPLALLANPWGWDLLRVPFRIREIVLSGHAPNLEWAPARFQHFPLLYLSVVAGILVLASGMRRIDLPPVLVAAAAAMLSFQHLRNLGFFFLLLPLALARPAASLEKRFRLDGRLGSVVAAAVLVLVSAQFLRADLEAGRRGILHRVEPRKAVDFIESRGLGRRLFNDVLFGGYLIWRRYPEHQVFIDGRNEVYGTLLAEIFDAVNSGEKWKALLDRHRIDAALLRRGQMETVVYPPTPGGPVRTESRAFSAAHFPTAQWALLYWDDQALVLVRRDDPAALPFLEGEYRIHPDDVPHTLALLARGDLDRREVLGEIDRKLREDPECLSARSLRARFEGAPSEGRASP